MTQMINNDASKWKVATLIETYWASSKIKYFRFNVEGYLPHKAGQHYVVRLTSADGYQASRYYSVANAPDDNNHIDFAIEILEEGEVSGYLQHLKVGDQLEIRGPLGGHFNWDHNQKDDLILIGGGSGIVPLLSILRDYVKSPDGRNVKLLYSVRDFKELIFMDELQKYSKGISGLQVFFTLTGQIPDGWSYGKSRLNLEVLQKELQGFDKKQADIYICGRNDFVEEISKSLVSLGFAFNNIRGERYG